jgi:hypothetical protein
MHWGGQFDGVGGKGVSVIVQLLFAGILPIV